MVDESETPDIDADAPLPSVTRRVVFIGLAVLGCLAVGLFVGGVGGVFFPRAMLESPFGTTTGVPRDASGMPLGENARSIPPQRLVLPGARNVVPMSFGKGSGVLFEVEFSPHEALREYRALFAEFGWREIPTTAAPAEELSEVIAGGESGELYAFTGPQRMALLRFEVEETVTRCVLIEMQSAR